MKKYIALFVWFGLPILMFGQIQKGSWMIGGRIDGNYAHQLREHDPTVIVKSFRNFNPVFAYFVSKRLSLGAEYNYYYLRTKRRAERGDRDLFRTYHSLRPFARFFITQGKFRPYLMTEMEYNATFLERTGGFFPFEKTKYFSWMGGFGFNWLFSENIALNASATFLIDDSGTKSELRISQNDRFFARFGMQFFLNQNQKPTAPVFENYYNRENFFWHLTSGGTQEYSELNFRILFSAAFRHFVSQKFEWGMNFGLHLDGLSGIKEEGFWEAKMHFGFYQPLSEKFRLFEKAELGYRLEGEYFNFFDFTEQRLFRASAMPGILCFPNDQSVLSASLNCTFSSGEEGRFTEIFGGDVTGFVKLFSFGWELSFEQFIQKNISLKVTGNWHLINEEFKDDNGANPLDGSNYHNKSNIQFAVNYYFFPKKRRLSEDY